jgi:hypothetical protein
MFEHEQGRQPRHYLSLGIRLHRGAQELGAEVVNAYAGGCLLRVSEPLPQGEVFEVSIPELKIPRARLLVLRSMAANSGYLVATCFDSPVVDEETSGQFSHGHPAGSEGSLLN